MWQDPKGGKKDGKKEGKKPAKETDGAVYWLAGLVRPRTVSSHHDCSCLRKSIATGTYIYVGVVGGIKVGIYTHGPGMYICHSIDLPFPHVQPTSGRFARSPGRISRAAASGPDLWCPAMG